MASETKQSPSLPPSADAVEAAKERLEAVLNTAVPMTVYHGNAHPVYLYSVNADDLRTLLAALSRAEDEDSKDDALDGVLAGQHALEALLEIAPDYAPFGAALARLRRAETILRSSRFAGATND